MRTKDLTGNRGNLALATMGALARATAYTGAPVSIDTIISHYIGHEINRSAISSRLCQLVGAGHVIRYGAGRKLGGTAKESPEYELSRKGKNYLRAVRDAIAP